MVAVDVILPRAGPRRWHGLAIDRLTKAGHNVRISVAGTADRANRLLDRFLAIERKLLGSSDTSLTGPIASLDPAMIDRPCVLVINFSQFDLRETKDAPELKLLFQGRSDLSAAAEMLCRGEVPVVDLTLEGVLVGHAAPMTTGRSFISRGLDDITARAVTLIVSFVDRYECRTFGRFALNHQRAAEKPSVASMRLVWSYLSSALPRLVLKAVRRLRYHEEYWRIGYRFIDGPGVVEKLSLDGAEWSVLPDAGDRYYADPFPFEWEGRQFIFVEEVVHAVGKGVISVTECDRDHRFGVPRVVLEKPYHLSYPQVFARDGEVWMIPESSAGCKVSLYRARQFPDDWVEIRVLLIDREICDATFLDHDGLFWLLGTERDGAGNASDTMVVFFAERIEGPWRPHPMNPILIDKSAARPGGRFARVGDRIVLPIQDGTVGYGGGLGVAELLCLTTEKVEMSKPVPIATDGGWPYPQIHTLNRHRLLETIDGIAKVAKRKQNSRLWIQKDS